MLNKLISVLWSQIVNLDTTISDFIKRNYTAKWTHFITVNTAAHTPTLWRIKREGHSTEDIMTKMLNFEMTLWGPKSLRTFDLGDDTAALLHRRASGQLSLKF